jgi:hypothetical protein
MMCATNALSPPFLPWQAEAEDVDAPPEQQLTSRVPHLLDMTACLMQHSGFKVGGVGLVRRGASNGQFRVDVPYHGSRPSCPS